MQVALTEKIVADVEAMSSQFVAENGYITCEFSVGTEHVVAMHELIQKKNRDLPDYGMWRIYKCEVCESHNVNSPYHVEIQVIDERPVYKEVEVR